MLQRCLLVGIVCCAIACGATTSRLRDIDGNPLPSYALNAAVGPILNLQCADGNSYLVVVDTSKLMVGPRLGKVIRLVTHDPGDVCDRILASSL